MATATAPPNTPKTTPSPSIDPMYQQALEQAQAALKPQIDTIAGEQTGSDALEHQREVDAIGADGKSGAYGALAGLLQGISPAIQGIYSNAAQNQELAANGFSQGMQDALKGNTDNLNSMLDKLGSPAQIDSHAQQAGDVLYGLGGYIPGETFNREGAAFASAAANLPGDALRQGNQVVDQLRVKQQSEDVGFQNKIAELAAKLPGDTATNYQKLQSMSIENKKLAEQISNDNFNQKYKLNQLKLQVAKYKTSVSEFNATHALNVAKYKASITEFNANYAIKVANKNIAAQRLAMDATKAANQQYNADRSYQLALGRLGVSQKSLQLKIAAAAFKAASGGFTQAQMTKMTEQANAMANAALHGSMKTSIVYDSNGQPIAKRSGSTMTGGISYNQALGEMMKKGIPVQVALSALDRVYPADKQPSPEALQNLLGPLTPGSIGALVGAGQQAANAGNKMNYIPGSAGGFIPQGTNVQMGRVDQGRDIQVAPGTPIVAPGSGVVVNVGSDPGGGGAHFGPQYPIVRFTSGPYAGKTIYIGHTVTHLKAGQSFNLGDVLSITQASGPLNGGAPSGWAEIGFAPGGSPGRFGQAPPF